MSQIKPPIDAVVQVVRPPGDLAVLSVGSQQGVQEGFEFTVHRRGRFVGRLLVIKVYPDLCAARILITAQGEAIQVGDKTEATLSYLCPLSRCRSAFSKRPP